MQKAGRGFTYRDVAGHTLRDDDTVARIRSLAIPPAWTDVWIPRFQTATSGDRAGFGRPPAVHLSSAMAGAKGPGQVHALDRARRDPPGRESTVTKDLRQKGITKTRVLAAGFRMLDTGSLRVGSERYAEANGSVGLTTLLCST